MIAIFQYFFFKHNLIKFFLILLKYKYSTNYFLSNSFIAKSPVLHLTKCTSPKLPLPIDEIF